MASWDIDPAGVRAVLARTGTHAEDLGAAVGSFAGHVGDAGSACGSGLVREALADFLFARQNELATARNRIDAVMSGTVKATVAYELGDEQMAASALQVADGAFHPSRGHRMVGWR